MPSATCPRTRRRPTAGRILEDLAREESARDETGAAAADPREGARRLRRGGRSAGGRGGRGPARRRPPPARAMGWQAVRPLLEREIAELEDLGGDEVDVVRARLEAALAAACTRALDLPATRAARDPCDRARPAAGRRRDGARCALLARCGPPVRRARRRGAQDRDLGHRPMPRAARRRRGGPRVPVGGRRPVRGVRATTWPSAGCATGSRSPSSTSCGTTAAT